MEKIPHEWLRRAGTPEHFERECLERSAAAFNLPLEKVEQKFGDRPFGDMTRAWRTFLQRLGEGDELWFFSSPDDAFAKRLGCEGYAIVRGGVIRDTLVTLRT